MFSLSALITFAFVSSITPGPNNIMLMTSGVNFGLKRSIPHLLGVNFGFTLMIFLVGTGVSGIFEAYPVVRQVLQVVSVIYLVYLSSKIMMTKQAAVKDNEKSAPMSFVQAVLFQWVNPKGWSMALTAVTLYSASNRVMDILVTALLFGLMNFPAVMSWVFFGTKLRKLIERPTFLRAFNISMGLGLLSSLLFLI